MLNALYILGKGVEGLLFLAVAYVFIVLFFPAMGTSGPTYEAPGIMVETYILTNGVHTDLVLPFHHELKDWSGMVSPADTKSPTFEARYVAFGWGDKGFYLNTPTWADLKASTAFNAVFGLSTTALHVTFYDQLEEGVSCRKILMPEGHYRDLVAYIQASFQQSEAGRPLLIEQVSYGAHDAFYEAVGTYNLFFTCNTWANKGLKTSGEKACIWTARTDDIFRLYPLQETAISAQK